MSGPTWHDWVLWSVAGVLGVGGALLLAWALFWDRARGRRRCPKCWYDMAGAVGLVCPECGKDARHARRLLRTRRRWRWAGIGVLLLAGGAASWVTVDVRRHGWWGATPRWALILLMPHLEDRGELTAATRWRNPLYRQIRLRLLRGEWELADLSPAERWLLEGASARAIKSRRPHQTKQLGAHFLVILHADPLARAPAGSRVHVVLAEMAHALGTCSSYRDRGRVEGGEGGEGWRVFLTAFRRSGEFRFESLGVSPGDPGLTERYAIWANTDVVKSWWSIGPNVRFERSLPMAIAAAAGVSRDAAVTVPQLLMPNVLRSAGSLAEIGAPTLAGTEVIDGRPCHVVSGVSVTKDAIRVWIDAQSWLVRRIELRGGVTTTYQPEINVEIDEGWFTFDPHRPEMSPLQVE